MNGHNIEIKQIPQMGYYTHLRNRSSIILSFYSKWPREDFKPGQIGNFDHKHHTYLYINASLTSGRKKKKKEKKKNFLPCTWVMVHEQ